MHYRFYVLDRVGGFVDVADALCADDEEARRHAEGKLGRAPAIQVWQRGRFVGQIQQGLAA